MTTMDQISDAMRLMQRPYVCPEDVKMRITALRVPADDGTVALGNGGRLSVNWRSGGGGHGQGHGHGHGHGHGQGQGHGQGNRLPGRRQPAPRFGNRALTTATVEDRIMDRIRDKMNKFSEVTYDSVKGWLSELLDSGQTGFLTDFITLVFEKAAMEATFCPLYARLITELRTSFPHLDVEMKRIFAEFMLVFVEANEEDASEYKAFLELRERRKYRRGYSAFLSEIAKLRVISSDDVIKTCNIILDGLMAAKVKEGQQMLCEEYADCLTTLMKRCAASLAASIGETMERVRIAMDKKESPSLSNKARFALMDLTDIFK